MARTQVFYWVGGSERGEWRPVLQLTEGSVEKTIETLGRAGYVALSVDPSIGPPDDAPSEERFKAVGLRPDGKTGIGYTS